MANEVIDIRLLGRFRVRRDGEEVPNERFGGRLPRRLVRVVATRPDEVVTREILIEALWPRRLPADPDSNLNVLVNRARRALGDPAAIDTATGGYRLCADRCRIDAEEFGRLLAEGRARLGEGHPGTALRTLLDALELWGEPLAEDTYEQWAQPVRDALLADYQVTLETAADAALLVHQPVEAASLARRAVAAAPLRERAHLILVRALAASGDRSGALATFRTLRRTLVDELGIDPSAEAAAVELRVLEGDSETEGSGAATEDRDSGPPPFVGRRDELEGLLSLLEGSRRVAVIGGAAGSGKSRLLEEFTARVALPVVTSRAFLPEATSPWALARSILGEALGHDLGAAHRLPPAVARAMADLVLPALADGVDGSSADFEDETRRALALQGGVTLLASVAAGGALLVVDDLQWADATSLDLLAVSAARIDELRMILAHRPLEDGGPVDAFLATLDEINTDLPITLDRLSVDEIARITGDSRLARVLDEETDGTPFAVHEVMTQLSSHRMGQSDPEDSKGSTEAAEERYEDARRAARAGKRRSVLARVARRSPRERQLLALLAVLGREASAALLARAGDQPSRQVIDDLDRLASVGLVRLGDRGWATAHDLIAETVLDDLGRADRGRWHLLVAEALGGEDAEPGERAVHLQGAGDERAAAAFASAARTQLQRLAYPEADRLVGLGLGLATAGGDEFEGELLAVRAEVRIHDGDLQGAREDLRRALTRAAGGPRRAMLQTRIASLAVANDDLEQANQLIDLALHDAGTDTGARARALALGSIVDMNGPDDNRARRRAEEALRLYEEVGDAAGVADVLDARAMATFLDGDLREGSAELGRVAQLFADSGNLLRVVTPRSTRGHGLVFLDEPARGLDATEAALDLARTLGHPEGQAFALWHRSEAQLALGRLDDAMDSAVNARRLAEQVGHRGWTATAWRAIGLVHEARSDDEAALDAYRHSLEFGGAVPLFTCWAHARLALTLVRLGELDTASRHAAEALATGPPLGQYEARLARAVVARQRDERDAAAVVADAHQRALDGGHLVSARELEGL